MHPSLVPHRGEVGAELAVARRRELEVVRLRDLDDHLRARARGRRSRRRARTRRPLRNEVVREPVAGEHAGAAERDAAVGEPVAHVHEPSPYPGDVRALALLPADGHRAQRRGRARANPRAGRRAGSRRTSSSTPSRSSIGSISSWKPLETIERPVLPRELAEAVAHAHVLAHPVDDLVQRRLHARELQRDHLVQRQLAPELALRRVVDPLVAELEQDEVEAVRLRHRPVPVEDEPHSSSTGGWTDCESVPMPSTSTWTTCAISTSSTRPGDGPARMSPG